ncbi:MAG: hypothetical protein ACXWT5_08980, partial [Methylophilus sp.]
CLWSLLWPSEKDHLNAQLEELCKKDGGVMVYETVNLPADMFDQFGKPKFDRNDLLKMPKNMQAHMLGDDYTYVIETTVLKAGDGWKEGSLVRSNYKILRNADKKILGEAVEYVRAGGDRWYLGHPSSDSCPLDATNITEKVFFKKSGGYSEETGK